MWKWIHGLLINIHPNYSFRARLGLAIGSVALGLALLLSYLVGVAISQEFSDRQGQLLAELAYQMADQIDRSLFESYQNLQFVATLDTISNPNVSLVTKQTIIEQLQKSYPNYAWVGLTNAKGEVIVSTKKIVIGQNFSQARWFKKGLEGIYISDEDETTITNSNILPKSPENLGKFINISTLVKAEDNQITGVLIGYIYWDLVKEFEKFILTSSKLNYQQAEMLILKSNGKVLLGASHFPKNSSYRDFPSFQKAAIYNHDYTVETMPNGTTYLTGFSRSQGYLDYLGLEWVILVRQPINLALKSAEKLQKKFLFGGLIFGIFSAILSGAIANYLIKPIVNLANILKNCRSPNSLLINETFTIPNYLKGQDEIAILSNSLAELLRYINQQNQALQNFNEELKEDINKRLRIESKLQIMNAQLENRVAERTGALEAINQSLQKEIKEREKTQAMLEQANQDLKEFARIVSHDLKMPLRSIIALSQWLVDDCGEQLNDLGKEQLQLLVNQAHYARKLVTNILNYSQIGSDNLEKVVMSLSELLKEAIDLLHPPAHITIEIISPLPQLLCNPIQVQQIFLNLLDNAIKYMDKPVGKITISCANYGKYWQFTIADNGPGIEPENFDRIFELFQSFGNLEDSTGVGLATVKKIVEMYGGKIWLESVIGAGTTFFLTMPIE